MAESWTPTEEEHNDLLFMQLVLLFQGAAMQQLGKIKNPLIDKIERNLDQARNTIDILGMLEAKTRGNLAERERQFLAHVLSELRLNFVDEINKPREQTEEKKEEPVEGEKKD